MIGLFIEDVAHKGQVIGLLLRHDVPDAGAGGFGADDAVHMGIGGPDPVDVSGGPASGHDVHQTVVWLPVLTGVGGRHGDFLLLVAVAVIEPALGGAHVGAHVGAEGPGQQLHAVLGLVGVGGRVVIGAVAVPGEVIDVVQHLKPVIDVHGLVDGQVVVGVVVVIHEVAGQSALQRGEDVFTLLGLHAEVLQLEVIDALEGGGAQGLGQELGDVRHHVGEVAVGLDEGGAVAGGGQGGERVEPVGLAAGEQRRDGTFLRMGGHVGLLLSIADLQEGGQLTAGCAAEAVAHQIDGVLGVPGALEQLVVFAAGVIPSEPVMAVLRRVGSAVVGSGAGELGVELAGAVPGAGAGAHRGSVGLHALIQQIVDHVGGGHAPIGDVGVELVIGAPAQQTVDQHHGVLGHVQGRGIGHLFVGVPEQTLSDEDRSELARALGGRQLAEPVEEGDDLPAGAGGGGGEGVHVGAFDNAVGMAPGHRVGVVLIRRHIGEVAGAASGGRACAAPEEGDGFGAGHGALGIEVGGVNASGDALLIGPEHRVIVIVAAAHIRKRVGARSLGGACAPPDERNHLGAGAAGVRGEGGVAGAVGDALADGPVHGVVIVGVAAHIRESGSGDADH